MHHYNYGLRAEDRLSGAYQRRDYRTGYFPGSRGPADIVATKGSSRLYMQVKAVRSTTVRITDCGAALDALFARLSGDDVSRLVRFVQISGGTAVAAFTNGDYYWTWCIAATRDEHIFSELHDGWLPKRALSRESA